MNKIKLTENKTKIIEINMNSDKVFKLNTVTEKVEHIKYLHICSRRGLVSSVSAY